MVTALCTVVLLALTLALVWLYTLGRTPDAVQDPERALALVVERTMDLEDAVAHAAPLERRLYRLSFGDGTSELPQALAWYEQLADYSLLPEVDLRVGVLEGEAGHLDDLRIRAQQWIRRPDPFPDYARLVAVAYLGEDDPAPEELPEVLERSLPPGWFQDRVAVRLGLRLGDGALLEAAREASAARQSPLLFRVRVIVGAELAVLTLGVVATLTLVVRRRRSGPVRVAQAPLPPPWPGRDGYAVLARGVVLAAVLLLGSAWAAAMLLPDHPLVEVIDQPLMYIPLLLLARWRLLRPAGHGLVDGFGLRPRARGLAPLVLFTAALGAAGFLIDLSLGLTTQSLGLTPHWTEWFDPDVAWGPPLAVVATIIGAVLLAPLFEEIVFRGLVYGTLRRRFGVGTAAVVSAAIFAVAHGYGAGGFASVFLSGVLWAWVYERSGSLLPAIAAHALNNLGVSLTLLWLLR